MRKQSTKWVVYFFVFALILVDCNLASGNSSHFLRRAIKISRKLERKICNYYRTRNFFELGRIIEKNLIDIQKLPKKHYNDCFYRALGSYYYFDKEYLPITNSLSSDDKKRPNLGPYFLPSSIL